MRNIGAAQHAFREAVRQDPQLVGAWRMLIRIALVRRDVLEAAKTVDEAMAANPENDMLEAIAQEASPRPAGASWRDRRPNSAADGVDAAMSIAAASPTGFHGCQ